MSSTVPSKTGSSGKSRRDVRQESPFIVFGQLLLLVLAIALAVGCSKSVDDDGKRLNPFVGITRTDATGTVLGLDPDDWCDDTTTGGGGVPTVYALSPAFPNLTNGVCTIRFTVPERCRVALAVRQWVGRVHVLARLLVDDKFDPGVHTVEWDGRDDRGELLRDDIYRVYLTAGVYGSDYQCYGDIQISNP
jgi:hypothetical protein